MPRYLILLVCLLALVFAASAFAADKSSGERDVVHSGGLMCFSITPPMEGGVSCDRLCMGKGAVCVGLKTNGAMNPGTGCGDATYPKLDGGYVASCRCCAVAR